MNKNNANRTLVEEFLFYLDLILKDAGFEKEKKDELKARFLKIWLTKAGISLDSELGDKEKKQLDKLTKDANQEEKVQIIDNFLQNLTEHKDRSEKVIDIYFNEAEEILKRVTDVYKQI